jgi:hypothetical protein
LADQQSFPTDHYRVTFAESHTAPLEQKARNLALYKHRAPPERKREALRVSAIYLTITDFARKERI